MKTVVAILCTAMLMLMSSPTNGQAPTSYQPPGVTFALTGLDIAPSPTVGASFVTVCDQDFTPFYNPTCPGTSGTVLCRATADAVLPGTAPGAPAGADAMWRDGNTGRVYIARAGVPFIDVYATTTSGGPWIQRHSYLTSFALNGPASSITVQRGTNRIVAAINNSLVPPQRRIDYIDPTTYQVAVTVTCTNVSSYDFVMTNCDGQIGVLLTGTDQNRYFTQNAGDCLQSYMLLGSSSMLINEYLVPDIWRNWWIATSGQPNREYGTLFKFSRFSSTTAFSSVFQL